MDNPITRAEHDEAMRRIDEHFSRVDGRLKDIEGDISDLKATNTTLEKLATNMEHMCREQRKQGERLERLEARDGEKWKSLMSYICTAIVSVLAGAVVALISVWL